MALGMNKADVGVSRTGINDLLKEVQKDTQEACNVCATDSAEFKALITEIRKYWSGEDCEAYIKDLQAAAGDLHQIVGQINTQIKTGIEKYQSEFAAFQKSNYKEGTTKIR